jgi:hypothetical protein
MYKEMLFTMLCGCNFFWHTEDVQERVMRKMFGSRCKERTGSWRKLHSAKLWFVPFPYRAIRPVDPGPAYTEFWVAGQNGTLTGFVGFLLDFSFLLAVSFHLPLNAENFLPSWEFVSCSRTAAWS